MINLGGTPKEHPGATGCSVSLENPNNSPLRLAGGVLAAVHKTK